MRNKEEPLIPTIPHAADGIRIDPPPSEPIATGHKPGRKKKPSIRSVARRFFP